MAENTVKYYIDIVGINTGNYRIHLDFEGNFLNSSYYAQNYRVIPFSGSAPLAPYGTGVLNSTNFLRLSGIVGLDSESWTQYFVVEKNNRNDGVLFSNFGGTGLYSGYTIGINAANNLYFETFNNVGPLVRTFSPILAHKNILAVSRRESTLGFYLLNQNTKEIFSETYDIDDYILLSNSWFLGTSTGNLSYQNYSNFSGYIDEWIYFDQANGFGDIKAVMSGFYQRYNNNTFQFQVTGFNAFQSGYLITGSPSGIGLDVTGTFYYSGNLAYNTGNPITIVDFSSITGFGQASDLCGGSLFFYTYLNQTGILRGNTFIPMTGSIFLTSQQTGQNIYYRPTGGSSYSGVTGYITGLTMIYSGLTGSTITFSGELTDNCGNLLGSYFVNDYSGIISGNSTIELSGLIASGFVENTGYYNSQSDFRITYVVNPTYYTNDGYIYSLGMNGLAYTRAVDNTDNHEAYLHHTKHNNTTFNKIGNFNPIKSGFSLDANYTISGTNVYLNGLAEMGSGFAVEGDFYNPIFIISGDYFISGSNLLKGQDYTIIDGIIYDIYSGVRDTKIKTTDVLQNINSQEAFLFLNGQKLRSGIEYTSSGNKTLISDSYMYDISGRLFTFPQNNGTRITGFSLPTATLSVPFAKGTSQLFLNGQRMELNSDYVEISNVDLLTGSGLFLGNLFGSYNNEGSFWS